MLHAAPKAVRSTECVIYPPASGPFLSEFNHARRVERSHGTAASFARHDLIPERTAPRPACQVNQCSFWIGECIRVMWHMDPTHAEEPRNPVAVCKEPSFNRADDEPETHVRRGIRKPLLNARRCAFAISVEINEDNPGGMVCCGVVAGNCSEQRCLSPSPVDGGEGQISLADDPMKHRLVEVALHCARHDGQGSGPEQHKLLRP